MTFVQGKEGGLRTEKSKAKVETLRPFRAEQVKRPHILEAQPTGIRVDGPG